MKITIESLGQGRIIEMVHLWNREIGHQFPMREELIKQNSFDDVNVFQSGSGIALNEKNEMIGFIISKRWQDNDIGINPN